MLTVRFNTGVSIQYNTATFVSRGDKYSDLWEKKGTNGQPNTGWVAQVPTEGCVIEGKPACLVYDATTRRTSTDAVQKELAAMNRRIARMNKARK